MLLIFSDFTLLQVSGEVTYNGQPLSSFLPQRTAAYVPQVLFLLSHARAQSYERMLIKVLEIIIHVMTSQYTSK